TLFRSAERARGGDGVGVGGQRLVHPLGVDALTDPLFHPHASTTGTAAETTFLVAVHLLGLDTGHLGHDVARRCVHLVVPAQEAGVVVGDVLLHGLHRGQLALVHEL